MNCFIFTKEIWYEKVICLNEYIKIFLICWYSIRNFFFFSSLVYIFTVERSFNRFLLQIDKSFLASKPINLLLVIFRQDATDLVITIKYLLGHSWKLYYQGLAPISLASVTYYLEFQSGIWLFKVVWILQ